MKRDFILPGQAFEAAYLKLYSSGELMERTEEALRRLTHCRLCPRRCGVDRTAGETGICEIGRFAQVSGYFAHYGEERCLSGRGGSGTIFLAGCNLRCVFCQNFETSQGSPFPESRKEDLARMMIDLQAKGCHNINLVTPSHVVPQILEALVCAVEQGLHLPLVYNTSGYDAPETLHLLDEIVDIYMPDFKMWDINAAEKYLLARDYPEVARIALREMQRQVGVLKMDEKGIARSGVLVRHLVMPDKIAGSAPVAAFIAREISVDTYINMMAQYHPAGKVDGGAFSKINRRVTRTEYAHTLQAVRNAGLHRIY